MRDKLIVADNSPSVQKAIQLSFSSSVFEIHPFGDGLELVKSLEHIKPDAVLLSFSLPGRNGYEVGSYLKSREELRNVSLIFLRGAFEPLDQAKIAEIAYDEIVQKPFDSGKLARLVKDIIERKKNPLPLPEEPLLEEESPGGTYVMRERELEEKIRVKILNELEQSLGRELEQIKDEIAKLKRG